MTTPRDLLCRFHIIIVHSIYHIPSSNERHARGNLITKKDAKREREKFSIVLLVFFLLVFIFFLYQMKLSNNSQSLNTTAAVFACTDGEKKNERTIDPAERCACSTLYFLHLVDNQLDRRERRSRTEKRKIKNERKRERIRERPLERKWEKERKRESNGLSSCISCSDRATATTTLPPPPPPPHHNHHTYIPATQLFYQWHRHFSVSQKKTEIERVYVCVCVRMNHQPSLYPFTLGFCHRAPIISKKKIFLDKNHLIKNNYS